MGLDSGKVKILESFIPVGFIEGADAPPRYKDKVFVLESKESIQATQQIA